MSNGEPAGIALNGASHRRRWLLFVLAVTGALAVAGAVALVLTSDHERDKPFALVVGGLLSASFMGTGLFAWWRRLPPTADAHRRVLAVLKYLEAPAAAQS